MSNTDHWPIIVDAWKEAARRNEEKFGRWSGATAFDCKEVLNERQQLPEYSEEDLAMTFSKNWNKA